MSLDSLNYVVLLSTAQCLYDLDAIRRCERYVEVVAIANQRAVNEHCHVFANVRLLVHHVMFHCWRGKEREFECVM